MKSTRKSKPSRSGKKAVRLFLGLAFLFIIYLMFFSGPRSVIQYFRQAAYKKSLEEQIQSLQHEKESLKKEAERLKNDLDYIEKIAREKYNMKKKDEKVYKIIKEK